MARTTDPDIPPAWQQLVQRALGPAINNPRTGGGDPARSWVAGKHYPPASAAARNPSELQAEVRSAFSATIACFNKRTENEHRAYWRRGLSGFMPALNSYLQRNLSDCLNGATCDDIKRPYAISFLGGTIPPWGVISVDLEPGEEQDIHLEIELDPAGLPGTQPDWMTTPYSVIIISNMLNPNPPYIDILAQQDFNPTARTTYAVDLIAPDTEETGKFLQIWTYQSLIAYATVWRVSVNGEDAITASWYWDTPDEPP
jgi:hypothetical protein